MVCTVGCLGHCPTQPSIKGLVLLGPYLVLVGLKGSKEGDTSLRAKMVDGPGPRHLEVPPGLPLAVPNTPDQVAHEGGHSGRVTVTPSPGLDSADPGGSKALEPAQGVSPNSKLNKPLF